MAAVINIGRQFSRYPVGRYRDDGSSNGELFREDVLRPALLRGPVVIELDDAFGYGSSFLEEVFGGLVRSGLSEKQVWSMISLLSEDAALIDEIHEYVRDAEASGRGAR